MYNWVIESDLFSQGRFVGNAKRSSIEFLSSLRTIDEVMDAAWENGQKFYGRTFALDDSMKVRELVVKRYPFNMFIGDDGALVPNFKELLKNLASRMKETAP